MSVNAKYNTNSNIYRARARACVCVYDIIRENRGMKNQENCINLAVKWREKGY